MKTEAYLFTGWAGFFGVMAAVYGVFAHEPGGKAALIVAFLMSALVAAFFWTQYLRRARRPQDRADAEIAEGAGPLDFFAPASGYPLLTAVGVTVLALGVVFGAWLALIGFGLLVPGVVGFVFQYARRSDGESR
ncbi:aa3-type cytochrome oxidase subunit IV [Kitasatospora azatica]|uniref:aa3-type cytochrome oxidase subunit IV n=1 Tax=Kitasatospora azatica TaxID=58347 RepID=UPI00055C1626|nr:cytochrome c oxidase subunit 4 [Kitasatospora azatica]